MKGYTPTDAGSLCRAPNGQYAPRALCTPTPAPINPAQCACAATNPAPSSYGPALLTFANGVALAGATPLITKGVEFILQLFCSFARK